MMRNDSQPAGESIEKVNLMSLEQLEHQLPLAQNSLEAIELELEALMALRDANPRSGYDGETRYPAARRRGHQGRCTKITSYDEIWRFVQDLITLDSVQPRLFVQSWHQAFENRMRPPATRGASGGHQKLPVYLFN